MRAVKYSKTALAVIIIMILFPLAAFAESARVAILPFAIHADKDYNFLRKGIEEMLTSRLSAPGKVEVVDPLATEEAIAGVKGKSGDSLAMAVGARLKADYVVHGSITVLGESVSIDAKALDIAGKRPALTFFKQAQGMGAVIPQINLLAADINQQVFDTQPPLATATAPPVAAPVVIAAPIPVPAPGAADVHMHPEKLLQSGPIKASEISPLATGAAAPSSTLNPAFVQAQGATTGESAKFWKSGTYTHLINGIDVGDVDRDGQLETVVATPDKIYVYRFAQGRRQTVAEIGADRFVRNISVDIGDVNGNGTPEIFVTAFTSGLNGLRSSVLEFDGQSFRPIVEKSFYFFRIVHHPRQGVILLGQKQTSTESLFDDPIFEMKYEGGDYVPARKVLTGGKANLLGLAIGDIMHEGAESLVALDSQDQLRVILPDGKTEWTSEENYGGTTLYYQPPFKGSGNTTEKEFLPVRVRLVDLDQDGKVEVLAADNRGKMSRAFAQQRFFKSSTIKAIAWDGLGLAPLWQTQQLSGRTQDFVVADFDNDGGEELLIAIINKEGSLVFSGAQSTLIAFDLNTP